MNREIILRGKDHYTGEWIEGYLIERNKKSWIVRYSLGQDPIGIIHNHWYVNTPSAVVDQKTVGQYIGKTDKNGVKIFEGDLVQYSPLKKTFEIVWSKSLLRFLCYSATGITPSAYNEHLVVVGNIYENESN
jgi:uncharacterized phage protein (TIGR01671 family)